MCSIPLRQEQLDNLKKFKYEYTNDSILYNHCMSPCLNKVVEKVPENIAPNTITLFSLICNIIAFTVTLLDGGFDFSHKLKSSTCFVIGLFQLSYQILDNIDGKQARRTGNSTPFGMLMDHGCDVFTNLFTAYNLSRLFLLGNDDIFSFSVFGGLILGFYMMTFEDYKVGAMHFPCINGVDEGNFSVFLLGILIGFTGQDWLKIVISEQYPTFTLGKAMGTFIFVGGIFSIIHLYIRTYNNKGFKEMSRIFCENMNFYSCILIPILYVYYRKEFYLQYKWILLLNVSLLFARITIDIQIKIVTMDTVGCGIIIIVYNLFIIGSFLIHTIYHNYIFLLCVASIQSIELASFIYHRANEITDYLKIKIFVINPVEQI